MLFNYINSRTQKYLLIMFTMLTGFLIITVWWGMSAFQEFYLDDSPASYYVIFIDSIFRFSVLIVACLVADIIHHQTTSDID